MADPNLGFALYQLPGQGKTKTKRAPDRAPDVAKLQNDIKTKQTMVFCRKSKRYVDGWMCFSLQAGKRVNVKKIRFPTYVAIVEHRWN